MKGPAFLHHRAWLFVWGVPAVLLISWLGGWWFTLAVAVISAVAGYETLGVLLPGKPRKTMVALVCGLLLILPVAILLHGVIALIWVFIAGLLLGGSLGLTQTPEVGFRYLTSTMFTLLYIGMPFTALLLLRHDPVWTSAFQGAAIVIYVWAGVWVTDTFAYLAGRRFGKRKLAPQLSPGKTIEGSVAGVIFALVWTILAGFMLQDLLTYVDRIALGLIIGVLSVMGDLVESMIKRVARVKDSGSILFGHGGVLDRFDSLLFVQPAVYLYLIAAGVLTSPSVPIEHVI